uniref:Kinetochore protein SPC25 n=1 Tax=Eutreptiella gymnastica TaxID=73025 RepID=A0A7S4C8K1_9EUGL|mmetsp:Transcript_6156/g.9488  ORF Transcript_6156/g.9488 Transcript_6156/m.9488 type:complete len:206 (-) Transcript_6156:180-797(-)|eukprot:CAMPEP_0174386854 /NCGR_PEP_ID=MMETSP0811_2-20130205/127560_1 /TAXON_ID=73025 ORGANISM="Eutreptiella gymnastica-like, Strain CCMP1594" /NCGR_SAMPLE_ID=MMETSP0811_2 /ASSEMBLY_ACC=CAM_ASM_000667 /LENGTH=205 /DNA_ID=CAMNT_0015541677 /DNA_START=51 /DNA_END=668 /DNA_ORIENTATION=+
MEYHHRASDVNTQIRMAFHNLNPVLQECSTNCETWGRNRISQLARDEMEHEKTLTQYKDELFDIYKDEMKVQATVQAQIDLGREHCGYTDTVTKNRESKFIESKDAILDDLLPFNQFCGLDVEILDGMVEFIFTLLDPQHPDRPFHFRIGVDDKENFIVEGVKPQVDYKEAYEKLQADNHFPRFVRNMRKLFKAYVIDHPDAMLE